MAGTQSKTPHSGGQAPWLNNDMINSRLALTEAALALPAHRRRDYFMDGRRLISRAALRSINPDFQQAPRFVFRRGTVR